MKNNTAQFIGHKDRLLLSGLGMFQSFKREDFGQSPQTFKNPLRRLFIDPA